jgi:hypothetical protein
MLSKWAKHLDYGGTIVRILAPVGIDTSSTEQIFGTKCHP